MRCILAQLCFSTAVLIRSVPCEQKLCVLHDCIMIIYFIDAPSVDLIRTDYDHADSCAISPSAFLLILRHGYCCYIGL